SYTAVAEYERCPYRFYLQRVLGMPDVAGVGDGSAAAARGVAVHALLETIDFAAPRAVTREAVAAAAAGAGVELGRDDDLAAVAALVDAFALSPLCARLAASGDVRRELPFAFAHDGELVRGFFDVAGVERDGTLLIVDYKSDRLDETADLAAQLERDYAIQRIVYALAGLASGVAPAVEVAHCFLARPEVPLGVRYAREDRVALEAQLTARLEPLRAGRYEVSPAPGPLRCGTCPGRARLCSHEQP
ncbi:MAG: RecB family exonuclease, partial [Solirubrobacteraceae bacterium]